MKHLFLRNLDTKHKVFPETTRRLLSKLHLVSNPPWKPPLSTPQPLLWLFHSLRLPLLPSPRSRHQTRQLATVRVDLKASSNSSPVPMAILSYLQALLPMQQFSCLLQPKALSQVTPINAPTANQPSHTYTSSTNTANAMIVLTSVQSQSANSIPKASHSAKISHGTEYLFTTTTAYPKPQLEDTFVHMPTANIRRRASSERTISIDMSAKCTPDSHDRTTNTTRHFSRQGDHNPGK